MKTLIRNCKIIVLLLFIVSCGNEKKDNSKPQEEQQKVVEQKQKIFSLKLKALVKKDDIFQLFYLQGEEEIFSAEQVITVKIIGSDEYQDILFKLPEEDYPYNFRIDLGSDAEQSNVMISECILSYANTDFSIKGSDLKKFFIFNNHIQQSSLDSTSYDMSKVGERYDPYIVGNKELIEALVTKI